MTPARTAGSSAMNKRATVSSATSKITMPTPCQSYSPCTTCLLQAHEMTVDGGRLLLRRRRHSLRPGQVYHIDPCRHIVLPSHGSPSADSVAGKHVFPHTPKMWVPASAGTTNEETLLPIRHTHICSHSVTPAQAEVHTYSETCLTASPSSSSYEYPLHRTELR